ncbi:LysM peptidoglycan-binding domain-containing protein [Pediococcus ethanolidurans]|uniref:LysM peptidoglycan-binding domain-containing protein n=1 Tax=Pediococcus ethanolidurans TaxID=319653 RepID=UPI001C1EF28A|nr:LysM peptidoglycan-binding domain-containing protein [Pediococcus ethanolidurans]MBU7554433.1 LysM peptidoglycan-binding domain-containing protein [Pediococcus ethanolidurans]
MKLKNKIILVGVVFLAAFSFGLNSKASTVPKPVGDFSEWQGNFTASQVQKLKSQVSFVILRVQYGSNYRDKTFAHNAALMTKYKVPYGVYSFSQYTSTSDAKKEAKDLYNRSKSALFYVNDAEALTTSAASYNNATKSWYTEMNSLTNKHIVFYSYRSFQTKYVPTAYKSYDAYWLAAYTSSVPSPQNYLLWQNTDAHYFSALNKSTDSSTLMWQKKPLSWWIGSTNASKQSTKVYKYGGIKKNWQVRIKKSATHWYNPRTKIPTSAKSLTYRVHSIQKITYSKSNEAVLLYRNGKAVGWALAQDIKKTTTKKAKAKAAYYTVKHGDTVSAIAAKHGTTTAKIKSMNNLTNVNYIYVGERLKVSGAAAKSTTKVYYTVRRGDTVSGIATKYSTTTAKLKYLNKLANANYIYVGERLKVSGSATKSASKTYYTIKYGNTLSYIASKYSTTTAKLKSLNNIYNANLIYTGQKLRIK